MSALTLFIGNRRTSSWSLRGWLAMARSGLVFDTRLVPLDQDDTQAALGALSPSATVPLLQTPQGAIWDSLAIAEFAAEHNPSLWPDDPFLRARARAACSQMHAGFFALRDECPMDLQRAPANITLREATQRDIARVQALWAEVKSGDGPFLFGDWSLADAFFTPVADRFRAYAIELQPDAQAYCETLLNDDTFSVWKSAALAETYTTVLDKPS